eukprot:XP_001694376.1 predicted protein [Chlamydomonas reinhardtii]
MGRLVLQAAAGCRSGWAQRAPASMWARGYSTEQNDATSGLPPAQGPLVGVKVLDLGQVVAGNFCGALLAYFGADVIKGRNRKCVTINLNVPEGRELVKRLSANVDVLVENFRPGVMEGWGLGPAHLRPDLIYTRISGYGQTGPRAPDPGYASVCEAYGGFRHLNGYPDRPPVRPNISLGDTLAGLHGAFGAVMALLHRNKLRQQQQPGASAAVGGQVVDAAISESVFNMEPQVLKTELGLTDAELEGLRAKGAI